jgi:hypothetical protein
MRQAQSLRRRFSISSQANLHQAERLPDRQTEWSASVLLHARGRGPESAPPIPSLTRTGPWPRADTRLCSLSPRPSVGPGVPAEAEGPAPQVPVALRRGRVVPEPGEQRHGRLLARERENLRSAALGRLAPEQGGGRPAAVTPGARQRSSPGPGPARARSHAEMR